MHCWKCGTKIEQVSGAHKVLRTDSCSKCDTDLHVCKNCRHYDPQYHNDCRETQAEWVNDKERANHCEYFEPGSRSGPAPSAKSSADQVKSAFDKLFEN